MNRKNMPQDETDVIRYLMKEMDPSEEMLMERAMMEDDDLLIEVESMRQTLRRLDDLPEKKPSHDLTASIVQQAADHKKSASWWPSIPSQIYKYAAVLLLGVGLGSGAWFIGSSSSSSPQAIPQFPVINLPSDPATTAKASDTKPWVDKNDIIYFQDKFSPKSGYKSIAKTSMEKLTPVQNGILQQNARANGVHLTSSHN